MDEIFVPAPQDVPFPRFVKPPLPACTRQISPSQLIGRFVVGTRTLPGRLGGLKMSRDNVDSIAICDTVAPVFDSAITFG